MSVEYEEEIKACLTKIENELAFARQNIADCPAHHNKDEVENTGELQHADGHIDKALSEIRRLRDDILNVPL